MTCSEYVYARDTYRRCGGKQQFRMHYNRRLCRRKAGADGKCWQHTPKPGTAKKETTYG